MADVDAIERPSNKDTSQKILLKIEDYIEVFISCPPDMSNVTLYVAVVVTRYVSFGCPGSTQ